MECDIYILRMNRLRIPQERIAARPGLDQKTTNYHLGKRAELPFSLNTELRREFTIPQVAEKHACLAHPNPAAQSTIGQSLVLHLLLGILIGVFYFAIVQPISNLVYPSIAALILAAIVVLIPFELGFLLYQGKRTGTISLEGIVLYRKG